ncbi:MAG: hypothetical protein AABX66_02905 [Nanoarchaeota archaeon]
MSLKETIKKIWNFLKADTWQSWLVSLVLMILFIKLIFFPSLSLLTGTSLPLLVVESCSMYHAQSFNNWWASHGAWYENQGINKTNFEMYSLKNGLNKGDIVLVTKAINPKSGQVIIYYPNDDATAPHPIIHRIVTENPIGTKGDNNPAQLTRTNNIMKVDETAIPQERIIGKATIKIPYLGWIKLIFFDIAKRINPSMYSSEVGLCKPN